MGCEDALGRPLTHVTGLMKSGLGLLLAAPTALAQPREMLRLRGNDLVSVLLRIRWKGGVNGRMRWVYVEELKEWAKA